MRPLIAIVNSSSFGRIFPAHLERLKAFAEITRIDVPVNISAADFADRLAPYHGIIASVNPDYPRRVLSELDKLVIITRHGIGFNNVDVDAALELGIAVTRVDGIVERAAVAEQAIALMTTAARQIVGGDRAVRAGRWADRAAFVGVELQNRPIGIIGLGNIGSRAGEILSRGFGAEVSAYDPAVDKATMARHGVVKVSDLNQLLVQSEIINLHCSLNADNYHMIGQQELAMMKDGVIIVNTARGELIEERAMLQALSSGKVRAYAADVVEGEPIGKDHPLLTHPNALIVPHLGGYTAESLGGMGETMVRNMEEVFIHNRLPANIILSGMQNKGLRKWH